MLTLLIFFCLIYVLVRFLGLYSEAVLLKLSGFLVLVSPITNTCVNAKHMHRDCFFLLGGCQVSHLPLSFFPLSFLCFLFFADALIFNTSGRPMLGERTCANLSCVILCHLASLCRLALMLFFLVMLCDGVDFGHSCLPSLFSPATMGAQDPTTVRGCWVRGRNGLGREVCPSSLVVGSAALSWPLRGMPPSKTGWLVPSKREKGRFRPKKPEEFQLEFLNFDLPAIHRGLGKNGMVALIGMQATGKTTTLQHVLWEAENPFFLKASHDDVHRAIHNQLRKNIWKLPWLLDGMRVDWGKTHEDVVTEVFEKVTEKTQKPVRLGFDVVAVTKHGIDEPHVSNIIEVPTGKENLHFPTNFDAKFFVKQVKYLCADRHVSSALISSSEGLMMLSLGEPRLRKMLGRELPISKSKAYLKALGQENISEEMLMEMPRTFEKLRGLSASAGKEAFCNKEMQGWVSAIQKTNTQFTNVKGLYQKALNEPIGIEDIVRAATSGKLATFTGADPEETFIQHMVKTNIFTPRGDGRYELQFDCQHKAVKKVFDL